MGKLEDFISKNKECWESFNRVIDSKITFAPTGEEKMIKCAISGDISKIISEFFKKNQEILDNVERNRDAEKDYIDRLAATKNAALDQVKDESIKKETEKRFDKITDIFKMILQDKLPATSVIKQCEQRFKQRIEKYPFSDEQRQLLYQGMFLMMLIHCFAWKEKDKVKTEPLAPEPQKIDSIFNTDDPYTNVTGKWLLRAFGLKSDSDPKGRYFSFIAGLPYNNKFTTEIPKAETDAACDWVRKHAKSFKQLLSFNVEAQEGPHKVLLTNDSRSIDPFVYFVFGDKPNRNIGYAYYYKASEVSDVKINGKNTGLKAYRFEIPSDSSVGWLDANLKPIWFRDITKEKKNYKKMTMDEMHEVAKAYKDLLDRKMVKYVQVTYQCVGDKILVSFKTNHFDTPPVVLNEADFEKVFNSPEKGTVLYRGTKVDDFESMRDKGISFNVNKHNGQFYGAGIYWTEDLSVTLKHGNVIAMAISCDKLPELLKDMLNDIMYKDTFLMRDNQCLVIRETAMCDERKVEDEELLEDMKRSPAAKHIVFCKTDKEVQDWLNCR